MLSTANYLTTSQSNLIHVEISSINSDYQTSSKGVFVAGDAGTGASLVVRAIFHGRKAAEAIDVFEID